MTKFMTAKVRLFSCICFFVVFTVATATASFLEMDAPLAWGLVSGGVAGLFAVCFLTFAEWRRFLTFMEAESRVEGEVLYCDRVFVSCGDTRRYAYLFLTMNRIYLYLWEKRPYLEAVADRSEITIETYLEEGRMVIRYPDTDCIHVKGADIAELIKELVGSAYTVSYRTSEEDTPHV